MSRGNGVRRKRGRPMEMEIFEMETDAIRGGENRRPGVTDATFLRRKREREEGCDCYRNFLFFFFFFNDLYFIVLY